MTFIYDLKSNKCRDVTYITIPNIIQSNVWEFEISQTRLFSENEENKNKKLLPSSEDDTITRNNTNIKIVSKRFSSLPRELIHWHKHPFLTRTQTPLWSWMCGRVWKERTSCNQQRRASSGSWRASTPLWSGKSFTLSTTDTSAKCLPFRNLISPKELRSVSLRTLPCTRFSTVCK